jgi:hypothetical protein
MHERLGAYPAYLLQVQESAGKETRKGVYVTAAEQHDLSGSKGTANFVMKWAKDSRHESYINVMELKGFTRAITGVLIEGCLPKIGNLALALLLSDSCRPASPPFPREAPKHHIGSACMPAGFQWDRQG